MYPRPVKPAKLLSVHIDMHMPLARDMRFAGILGGETEILCVDMNVPSGLGVFMR